MKTIRTIWQRSLVALLLFVAAMPLSSQVPYGYAPTNPVAEELSALGGNKNQFVQGLTKFDPAQDPVLQRLKGKEVKGVRCYVRADYKQARQKRSGILASSGKPDNIVRQTYADLSEGWNDVLFDEPFVIGDEAFYLGWQAYETIGTPYPLVAYAKATVPQSCWVNQAKKSWEEYTDRGTLLIFALLDDEAAAEFNNAAYTQNTTHPQTVAPNQDFTGGLYIHNFSPYPIENLEIAMQGEGATEPTYQTITLPTPLEAYGSTVVVAQLRAGTTEGTSVDWSCSVSKINDKTGQSGRPGVTKLYVTVDNFQRVPIVEEFTSQRCINCPQMAYFLEKAFEQYGGPYVYLSHHSGFAEDVFTTEPDRQIKYIFGGYENEYNPKHRHSGHSRHVAHALFGGIGKGGADASDGRGEHGGRRVEHHRFGPHRPRPRQSAALPVVLPRRRRHFRREISAVGHGRCGCTQRFEGRFPPQRCHSTLFHERGRRRPAQREQRRHLQRQFRVGRKDGIRWKWPAACRLDSQGEQG